LPLSLVAYPFGAAGDDPSPIRQFSFNWKGYHPASVAPSFPNGTPPTVYVDAVNGSDSAAGLAKAVPLGSGAGANAFQHIWKAVDSTTNTLIVVKGNFSEVITNVNGHLFYFMPGATNSLPLLPAGVPAMFYNPLGASNLNLYVGGFGTFITGSGGGDPYSGAIVSWRGIPPWAITNCQFQAAYVDSYGDAFDTLPSTLTADFLLGSITCHQGSIFDHSIATVFIYDSLLLMDGADPFDESVQGPINLVNCNVQLKNYPGLYGNVSTYGGNWSAPDGQFTELGSIAFHNTVFDSPDSIPSQAGNFTVSGYYTVANSNNFIGAFSGIVSGDGTGLTNLPFSSLIATNSPAPINKAAPSAWISIRLADGSVVRVPAYK
jgi:hypothetical protein